MEHSLMVDGESVRCPDGQNIPLEDLRDVALPQKFESHQRQLVDGSGPTYKD